MLKTRHRRAQADRTGAAAAEFAFALPLLLLFFIGLCDFARIFFYSVTVDNCARNGAMYAVDQVAAEKLPYNSAEEAALADAGDLSPQPTVTVTNGKDTGGDKYVEVSVSYPYSMASRMLGFSHVVQLQRTVRVRLGRELPPDE